jgi:hypothetical protein
MSISMYEVKGIWWGVLEKLSFYRVKYCIMEITKTQATVIID